MKCEKMAAMRTLLPLLLLAQLNFTAPSAWQARPAASTMRVAEFVVPKAAGDTEDAELIVYFFGASSGGSADANVDRWIGQMQQPDGSASKDKARREAQTINGLKVTMVDLTGTYVAEVRPGRPNTTTSRTSGCAPRWSKRRAGRTTSR